ncbi:MAG: hypothetical protein ISS19_07100 [Bacteroidales bacterium]|nr:hypothetical protein [Bacteroidales bacterium]
MKENLTIVAFYVAILAGIFIVAAVLYEFMKNHELGKYRIFALILGFLFIGSPFIGRITLRLPGDTELIVEKMDGELESLTVFLDELEAEYTSLKAGISNLQQDMGPIINQVRAGQITPENTVKIFTDISDNLEYIYNQSDSLTLKLEKARNENRKLVKNLKNVKSKIY